MTSHPHPMDTGLCPVPDIADARHRIVAWYDVRGDLAYEDEGVTQLQHAWQCGQLAARAGAAPALQLAAWVHDLGHLLSRRPGTPTLQGHDDRHEQLAADWLAPLFGAAVAEPVRGHVDAKRFLVGLHPVYADRLSPDSRRSLALQGGPMDAAEAREFRQRPHADDALRLRAWDDLGKLPHWQPASRRAALQELDALLAACSGAAVRQAV